MNRTLRSSLLLSFAVVLVVLPARALEPPIPTGSPAATVDLSTAEGVGLVKGQWRYSDTRIVEVDFRAAGSDGQPTGAPTRTYDFTPHAGAADFDDSTWPVIEPTSLDQRRGNGRLAFNWYRIGITVPHRIGDFDAAGATVLFETSIDDYAEVWVNGELPRALGQSGGSVVAGWNATNRLVIARNVKPGQRIQLAIFGANGPLSNPPTNFIYMRYARLHFYREKNPGPYAVVPYEVNVEVLRLDPALDGIVPENPKVFKLAEGFTFTEGPVWVDRGGYLLFSDPNENKIWKYSGDGQLTLFREPSGYSGADIADYRQPGSNGLALDPQGRLTINQHGNRRIVQLDESGDERVLIDRFNGKRLNSPNDLVFRSDGTLFFTDPPFGLPKAHDDLRRETPHFGVYSLHKGRLNLLTAEFTGPNGIALSPDEKYLYVGNWDERKKVVYRYDVQPDGTVTNGHLFFDLTSGQGEDAIDGVKVDERGNVYVSGPGGLWIISPEGKHLGTIVTPMHPHNMAWGDSDRKSLFLTARNGVYRIRLKVAGAGLRR